MHARTRLTEKQVRDIIEAHYKSRNIKVKSISIGRETYGGDPRETPYSYIDVDFEMADP